MNYARGNFQSTFYMTQIHNSHTISTCHKEAFLTDLGEFGLDWLNLKKIGERRRVTLRDPTLQGRSSHVQGGM